MLPVIDKHHARCRHTHGGKQRHTCDGRYEDAQSDNGRRYHRQSRAGPRVDLRPGPIPAHGTGRRGGGDGHRQGCNAGGFAVRSVLTGEYADPGAASAR